MTYAFRILPLGLRATAEAAAAWAVRDLGVRKSDIVVEEQFHRDINFRPTFHATLDDGHLLCMEVSESIYNNTLDAVSLDCRNRGLPVRLFVVVPKSNTSDPLYATRLREAKRAGVGILEVDDVSGDIIQQALSLSLAGVRHVDWSEFPRKYRNSLQSAHQTFRDGEPNKACSLVYDEVEACFRKFAEKCFAKRLWANAGGINLSKDSWANIIQALDKGLDRSDPSTKAVTKTLLARMLGVTPHRNDSGHKLTTTKARLKRDRELRTRFEGGLDLFTDFLTATKKFRL